MLVTTIVSMRESKKRDPLCVEVGLWKYWVVVRRVRSVVGYNTSAIVVSLPEWLVMHLIGVD